MSASGILHDIQQDVTHNDLIEIALSAISLGRRIEPVSQTVARPTDSIERTQVQGRLQGAETTELLRMSTEKTPG